ncbi:MAG: pitrilysin family protein [Bdellovibrionia bacterium]
MTFFLKKIIGFGMILFLSHSGFSFAETPLKLLPVPVIETLPNGLNVAWFIDNRLPIVDLSLIVEAGHRDDPVGLSGTADLVAASLDRGAGGMTTQQLSRAIDFMGGISYASADDDSSIVGMHGLATDASELLGILGKLTLQPEFLKSQVELQRSRLVDRWSHLEDYSAALVSNVYHRILAADTLYGRGGLASIRELKRVNQKDVVKFYHKYFTAKNSILVVIGRVDPSDFRAKIASVFGTWGPGDAAKETSSVILSKAIKLGPKNRNLKRKKDSIVLVNRPLLTQAQIRMGFRVPSVRSPEHYPLLVANALLGGYFGSRLNSEIRDKLGLTYGITSAITYNKEYAEFTISTATRNESVGQLIHKVSESLLQLKNGTVPSTEVDAAKSYLEGGFPLLVSTLESVASRWLTGFVFELGPDFLNEFIPKIHAVTQSEVQNAIQKSFDVKNLVVVIAGDSKEIKKSLALSKFNSVKQVAISDLK